MRSIPHRDATLLDVLVDGFEKNESLDGFHWRSLPMPDEETAARKLTEWADEVTRWRGPPTRSVTSGPRRIAAWPDLELRQAGRGLMVRARAPNFGAWWNAPDTWRSDPMSELHAWLEEERRSE